MRTAASTASELLSCGDEQIATAQATLPAERVKRAGPRPGSRNHLDEGEKLCPLFCSSFSPCFSLFSPHIRLFASLPGPRPIIDEKGIVTSAEMTNSRPSMMTRSLQG
jgi:hypothetical protein